MFASYHVQCRANYTSISNLPTAMVPSGSKSMDDFPSGLSSRPTRQTTDLFDIRVHFFFLFSKITKKIKVKGIWVREKLTPV